MTQPPVSTNPNGRNDVGATDGWSELDHILLDDSYFLGVTAEGADLCFRGLFALTQSHRDHAPPVAGEQHCYRHGRLRFTAAEVLEIRGSNTPPVLSDPDGTIDFGSIEVVRHDAGIAVSTEWFTMLVAPCGITVELDGNVADAP